MPIEINIYKRYSNAPGNARVVDGQSVNDDSVAVEVEMVGIESTTEAYSFNCPWCAKPYSAHRSERSLVLNCVRCGKQMMVTAEGTGAIDQSRQIAQPTATDAGASPGQSAAEPLDSRIEPEPESMEDDDRVENYAFDIWMAALLKPSVRTFDSILKCTVPSAKRAFRWMFMSGGISSFIAIFALLVPESGGRLACSLPMIVGAAVLGFMLVLGFALYTGVTHVTAMLFGGANRYSELAYVMAAYLAPLILLPVILTVVLGYGLVGLLSVIPIQSSQGLLAGIAMSCIPYAPFFILLVSISPVIYGLVLHVMAVKATYKLEWGNTIASSLIASFTFIGIVIGILGVMWGWALIGT